MSSKIKTSEHDTLLPANLSFLEARGNSRDSYHDLRRYSIRRSLPMAVLLWVVRTGIKHLVAPVVMTLIAVVFAWWLFPLALGSLGSLFWESMEWTSVGGWRESATDFLENVFRTVP